jgi:hypothetical protein
MKARTLKTLQPDPGTILWLPETDPTHTITSGCLDHPVLILSPEPSGIRVCLVRLLWYTHCNC